jgi:hypothetical protein
MKDVSDSDVHGLEFVSCNMQLSDHNFTSRQRSVPSLIGNSSF